MDEFQCRALSMTLLIMSTGLKASTSLMEIQLSLSDRRAVRDAAQAAAESYEEAAALCREVQKEAQSGLFDA